MEKINCRSCQKEIVFMKTSKGKRIPVDYETVSEEDELFDPKKHTSHFATCPQANEWRKK